MATNCSLLNFCVTVCIFLIWCNNFVTTSDELENMDFQQSNNEIALTPMQMEILKKWHIHVDIENLINITNQNIESPRIMTKNLFTLILGEKLLYNMTINKKSNSVLKYNPIPENVKNFVFEYVNRNTESGIDNSTFFQTVKMLCNYIRMKNRGQLRSTGDDGTLTRLQDQLLQKWNINASDKILNYITRRYNDRPNRMIIELLKMILGDDILENIAINRMKMTYVRDKIIPKNVQDFIIEYVNLHTKSNIDLKTLLKVILAKVNNLRQKFKITPPMKDQLPDFNIDELQMYGIDFQEENSDLFSEFLPVDYVQSEDEDTFNLTKTELLQKWHIDANVKNLTLITEKYIDKPTKMTTELMLMILGKNMLLNMVPKISSRNCIMYAYIPENVQNFVLEYVNSHAKSRIDNSTYLETLSLLCRRLRSINKSRSLTNDTSTTIEETLSPLQVELLQKFHINLNEQVLNAITKQYHNNNKKMSIELLKIILGERNLQNRCIKNHSDKVYQPIPENVLNFVYEYMNSFAEAKMNKPTFLTSISNYCSNSRYHNSKRNNNLLE